MLIFLRFFVPRLRRPKLGQHFLTDPGYRSRIAQSLSLQADELVIEIGAELVSVHGEDSVGDREDLQGARYGSDG